MTAPTPASSIVAHAAAQPAGKQPEQIAKRLAESRVFTIDCAALLAQHELVVKAGGARSTSPHVQVEAVRTRQGRYLELRVTGGQVPDGARHADQIVSALIDTTTGQQLVAALQLRVYAE